METFQRFVKCCVCTDRQTDRLSEASEFIKMCDFPKELKENQINSLLMIRMYRSI